jgi:hypothetical protein
MPSQISDGSSDSGVDSQPAQYKYQPIPIYSYKLTANGRQQLKNVPFPMCCKLKAKGHKITPTTTCNAQTQALSSIGSTGWDESTFSCIGGGVIGPSVLNQRDF